MNQILYTKEIENVKNSSIHYSDKTNKKNKKNQTFIIFLVFIIVILLFISINIYASAYKENTSNNDILSISKINNQENVNEEETIIEDIKNNEEDSNIEKDEKKSNSITYTTSDGNNYDVIATLNIPSLGIKYPVLSTTSTELLKVALNKYWGADPNQVGNMVIVGHNYKNTKFFSKLPNIQIGSIVKITDITGKTLDYNVYETKVINPYDNSCTSQLTDGHTEITLITCCNNGTKRFIAKARAN